MQVRSLKGTIRAQDTIPRRRPTLVQTADQKVLPTSARRSCNPAGDISGSAQGIPLTVGLLVLCDWVHSAVRVKHRRGLQRVRLHILALREHVRAVLKANSSLDSASNRTDRPSSSD